MTNLNRKLSNKVLRKPKIRRNKNPMLDKCPQKKGHCTKVFIGSPRKPNSAARRVAKLILAKSKKTPTVFCPGIGHSLQKFSSVLIRGGNVNDLPSIRYRMIRGKYDLKSVNGRMNGRSKYGSFKRRVRIIVAKQNKK